MSDNRYENIIECLREEIKNNLDEIIKLRRQIEKKDYQIEEQNKIIDILKEQVKIIDKLLSLNQNN